LYKLTGYLEISVKMLLPQFKIILFQKTQVKSSKLKILKATAINQSSKFWEKKPGMS